MTLHERLAVALGWTVVQTQSFSLAALREMVRPVSPKLAHEVTIAMKGLCLTTREESIQETSEGVTTGRSQKTPG